MATTPFAQRSGSLNTYQTMSDGSASVHIPHHRHHREEHPTLANMSSLVLGAMDGVVTCFCLVASSVGLGLPGVTIFTLGLATLAGDAISMGMAEFLSKRAEENVVVAETEREWAEMQVLPEEEKMEMQEIMVSKGMTPENASQIIEIMWLTPKLFLEWMMMYELQLIPSDEVLEARVNPRAAALAEKNKSGWEWPGLESPAGAGLTTLIAFFLLGAVPLFPFLFAGHDHRISKDDPIIWVSLLLSIIAMFLLGWGKSKAIHKRSHSHWMDGAVAAGYGTAASLLAFFIGHHLGGGLH